MPKRLSRRTTRISATSAVCGTSLAVPGGSVSYESALTSLTHSLLAPCLSQYQAYLYAIIFYSLPLYFIIPLAIPHISFVFIIRPQSTSHASRLARLSTPHCYASSCIRPRSRSWSFPCCIFIHAVALYEDPRCSLDILPQIQNTEIKKTVDLIPVSVGFQSNLRQAFNIHACRSGVLSGCSQDRLANRDRMSRVY